MISILMPIYNGIEFLDESVSSVINQTYPNWELLIGINGIALNSEDDLTIRNKIEQYHNDRIVIMGGMEKGKSKTLNTIVGRAKYDVICLLDADDVWLPTKLEKQLPYMEKYDVVGTNAQYFGERSDEAPIFLGQLPKEMFSFQNPLINSSIMLKKSDAYWDEKWECINDYDLYVRLLNQDKTFYNVAEILIKHRIHQASCFANKYEWLRLKLLQRLPILNTEQNERLGRLLGNKNWIL
jgi:teichuronic acid biosynthesis glycosyltransferase TuaG